MLNFPCSTACVTQKNLISIERERYLLRVIFAMPTAVEQLQCISVGGWGCPIFLGVSRKIVACLQSRKSVLSLDLAAETTMKHNIAHKVKHAPFNLMGLMGSARKPMKKNPHAWLWAFASKWYDASKWILRIMLEVWNLTMALGCIAKKTSGFFFNLVLTIPFVCLPAIVLSTMSTVRSTVQA
jgi:hypothetical protein